MAVGPRVNGRGESLRGGVGLVTVCEGILLSMG